MPAKRSWRLFDQIAGELLAAVHVGLQGFHITGCIESLAAKGALVLFEALQEQLAVDANGIGGEEPLLESLDSLRTWTANLTRLTRISTDRSFSS